MSAGSAMESGRSSGNIVSAVADTVRLAQEYLNKAVDASHGYDPQVVKQIRTELASLDAVLAQLTEVRTIRNEELLREGAGRLKLQVAVLQEVSDDVKRTASDTVTPPGVGGYMEQTVTLIAQAIVLIRELP